MDGPLKYAVVERERRYLLASLPDGVTSTRHITDRYVTGTRLRLREVRAADGAVVRKLGQKVRLSEGPGEIACTSCCLDDEEWAVLVALPARTLRKRRHTVARDGWLLAVDEPSDRVPDWLDVVRDVTRDEAWTGGGLAR